MDKNIQYLFLFIIPYIWNLIWFLLTCWTEETGKAIKLWRIEHPQSQNIVVWNIVHHFHRILWRIRQRNNRFKIHEKIDIFIAFLIFLVMKKWGGHLILCPPLRKKWGGHVPPVRAPATPLHLTTQHWFHNPSILTHVEEVSVKVVIGAGGITQPTLKKCL